MADPSARPPRPPRWIRPRSVVLLVVLVLLAVVVYAVSWALTAEPEPTVDYGQRMEALTARAQPPGENGWPHLVAAAQITEQVFADLEPPPVNFDDTGIEATAQRRQMIAALDARGAFVRLARAGQCPNAVHPRPSLEEGSLLLSLMPELAQLRRLAKARVASMEVAIAEGAHAEAVEAFDQALVIAWACSHQATLIEQLVGWSVATLALERLRYALIEQRVDAPTARRFLERLAARRPLGDPTLGLEGERLGFLDVVQRTHSDNGRGSGRVVPTAAGEFVHVTGAGPPGQPRPDSPRIVNLLGFVLPSRKAITKKADAFYDEMVRRSRLPYPQRRGAGAGTGPYDEIEKLGPRYFLLHMLIPAVGRFMDQADFMQCRIDGTRLHLAIEGYRAQHGRYPDNLGALVPGWVDAVPADPLSGSPFGYRLVTGDEHGRGYVLYSVGADGVDDGGAASPQQPQAAFRDLGAGLDFVFNQPRPPAEPN